MDISLFDIQSTVASTAVTIFITGNNSNTDRLQIKIQSYFKTKPLNDRLPCIILLYNRPVRLTYYNWYCNILTLPITLTCAYLKTPFIINCAKHRLC